MTSKLTCGQVKQLYFKKQNEGLSDLELVQLKKFLEESELLHKDSPNMKQYFNNAVKFLCDNSDSYKNIFNGMYDKSSDEYGDDNPVCRLCLNYVVGRGYSNRYECAETSIFNDKNTYDKNTYDDIIMIPFCDQCGEKIHDDFDKNNGKYYLVYDNKIFSIDIIHRGNM